MTDNRPHRHRELGEPLASGSRAVRAEVAKAVVGQDAAVSGLLVALLCGGHVLMEGVPGTAKTLLVRTLAGALSVDTRRVQFTPDLMPGDITGSMVIDSRQAGELSFREGPVFTNLLLADEINRTPPKTQSALLEAMEEGQVSVDGVSRQLPRAVPGRGDPEPDRVRRHLPAARGPARPVPAQGGAADPGARRGAARSCAGTPPGSTRATSGPPASTAVAGAGRHRRRAGRGQDRPGLPRGGRLHRRHRPGDPRVARRSASASARAAPPRCCASARAWAWLTGRDFVTPDDVKALAHATLVHRLGLRPEAELEGVDVAEVLASALGSVPVPR